MTTPEPIKQTLSNGVRIIVEPVPYVKSASIGLWCHTGSVNERENEAGITHLIEHMLFKGTESRTAKQIAAEIESKGGSLNAFTDKESTCYYAHCLGEEAETAIDVLTDMVLHPKIDATELKREEQVVVEEIKQIIDEPGDYVHDLHVRSVFRDHPLGKPIIGTEESVLGFERENILNYMSRRYVGDNLLITVVGNVEPEPIISTIQARLGKVSPGKRESSPSPAVFRTNEEFNTASVEQVHFCIGAPGVTVTDERIYVLNVLDAVLGGGMSSRLFQNIREQKGLCYSIGSYAATYQTGGLFTIYGGTSRKNWDEMLASVIAECKNLIDHKLPEEELQNVKNQLRGSMALSLESTRSRMSRLSRIELNFGRYIPIEESLAKLDRVTTEDVHDLVSELLDPERLSVTAILGES